MLVSCICRPSLIAVQTPLAGHTGTWAAIAWGSYRHLTKLPDSFPPAAVWGRASNATKTTAASSPVLRSHAVAGVPGPARFIQDAQAKAAAHANFSLRVLNGKMTHSLVLDRSRFALAESEEWSLGKDDFQIHGACGAFLQEGCNVVVGQVLGVLKGPGSNHGCSLKRFLTAEMTTPHP